LAVATPKTDVAGLSLAELTGFLVDAGEKPYRSVQLYRWIHQRGAVSFDELSDLPKSLREQLGQIATIVTVELDLAQVSADGTIKYRWRTGDGKLVESVYMPSPDRRTLCISTQAGCAMGCRFCATGTLGLARHLSASEIVGQVHAVNRDLVQREGHRTRRPLTNLVFMGMGEPLHNFEHVRRALELLQSEDGPGFSHRHITVSTVGLVPMIERFAQETSVKLAISLNASNDVVRDRIMPVNRKWNIEELLDAVRRFPAKQGRRITFEYVLLDGLNDSDDDARRLARLLQGLRAKVNLIPYNENPGLSFRASSPERAERFRELLAAARIDAFVRANRGRDIAAACGQLANVEKQLGSSTPSAIEP
jgi:23S rRNA (adenine2503-C2)-methyltransferase